MTTPETKLGFVADLDSSYYTDRTKVERLGARLKGKTRLLEVMGAIEAEEREQKDGPLNPDDPGTAVLLALGSWHGKSNDPDSLREAMARSNASYLATMAFLMRSDPYGAWPDTVHTPSRFVHLVNVAEQRIVTEADNG